MKRLDWHHHKIEEMFAIAYGALSALCAMAGRPWLSNTFATFAVICFAKAVYHAFTNRKRPRP